MTPLDAIRDIVAAILCLAVTMWYLLTPQPPWGILRLEAVVFTIIMTIGVTHGKSNLLILWQTVAGPMLDWFARRRKSM
jgi:hypothetical protein